MSINANHSIGAIMEKPPPFRDIFADHTVVDGRLVTGQIQKALSDGANKMMVAAKGGLK